MGLFSAFSSLSPVHIHFKTFFSRAKRIGTDSFGNCYYEGKPIRGYARARRWVIYKGKPDASAIPPEWHGWIHHQTNVIPEEGTKSFRRKWQKPYTPNMTGTVKAYRPKGHGGKRAKATGDYEAWKPNDK